MSSTIEQHNAGAYPAAVASRALLPSLPARGGQDPWELRRRSPVIQLCQLAAQLRRQLAESLAQRGFVGLRPSFAPVLRLVADQGVPIGLIADALGISPQAASQSAALEALGYARRRPNPADGRPIEGGGVVLGTRCPETTERARRPYSRGALRSLPALRTSHRDHGPHSDVERLGSLR